MPPRTVSRLTPRETILLLVASTSAFVVPGPAVPLPRRRRLGAKPPGWLEEAQSVALIAGSTVGGGVLALPTVCLDVGVDWSYAEIGILWLVNAATGFIIAEASCQELENGEETTTLKGLFERELGPFAGSATAVLLMLSNGLLLAAYATEGGAAIGDVLGGTPGGGNIPLYALVTSAVVAATSEKALDAANTAAVLVMALTFGCFISQWAPFVSVDHHAAMSALVFPDHLMSAFWKAAPVVSSALVFQSIVPVVAEKLSGDAERTKRAVAYGSFLPALCYAAFTTAVLGRFPTHEGLLYRTDGLLDPLQHLPTDVVETSRLALAFFSLCAVTTSFVGTAISQRHELNGMFRLPRLATDVIALAPPALTAIAFASDGTDNSFFVLAIALTGALANPLLFGAFPVAIHLQETFGRRPTNDLLDIVEPTIDKAMLDPFDFVVDKPTLTTTTKTPTTPPPGGYQDLLKLADRILQRRSPLPLLLDVPSETTLKAAARRNNKNT